MKRSIAVFPLFAVAALLPSSGNAATLPVELTTTFSGKTGSAINLEPASDAGVLLNGTFESLVTVNHATGLPTSTAVRFQTSGTAGSNAMLFTPNTNVQTAAGWQALFTYTCNAEIALSSLTLNAFTFAANGGWQAAGNNKKAVFRIDVLNADGTSLLASGDAAWHPEVTFPGNGVNTSLPITLSSPVTLPANTPFQLKVAFNRDTETNGCFFGLRNIIFNGVLTAPSININFLGKRASDDGGRGLGLAVNDFEGTAIGMIPVDAPLWNDVEANTTAALIDDSGELAGSVTSTASWAVNATYMSKATIESGSYTAEQALYYGYVDNGNTITLSAIPYPTYTLYLYFTSGNDYTLARDFPPVFINGSYYSGNGSATVSSPTLPDPWGNHRYSFANPAFETGAPVYKNGANVLVIPSQTGSQLQVAIQNASGSNTFGGIAAIQIVHESDIVYENFYAVTVSGNALWSDLTWRLGYETGLTLPENLTDAVLKIELEDGAELTIPSGTPLESAHPFFLGTGSVLIPGTLSCGTLNLNDTEGEITLAISGMLTLTGTGEPWRSALEVAQPNTVALSGGLRADGAVTANLTISGNASVSTDSVAPGAELELSGAIRADEETLDAVLTVASGSVALLGDVQTPVAVEPDASLRLADSDMLSVEAVILNGGALLADGYQTLPLLTLTTDSTLSLFSTETLTLTALAAENNALLTLSGFSSGKLQLDETTGVETFRLEGRPGARFGVRADGLVYLIKTGTALILQ